VTDGRVFEATDIGMVARALLDTMDATSARGDLVAVSMAITRNPHRLFIHTRLKKGELAQALGIKGKALRASEYRLFNFSDAASGSLGDTGARMVSPKRAAFLLGQAAEG